MKVVLRRSILVLAVAVVSIVVLSTTSAEQDSPLEDDIALSDDYQALQETDVVISELHYTDADNGEIEDGGSSILAPTYHDTYVTAEDNTVTFNNIALLSDNRVKSSKWEVDFSMIVYEVVNEELEFVKSEITDIVEYQPPTQISTYQTIDITVDYIGIETHIYSVGTEYTIYKVKKDGELKVHSSTAFFETAYVHEVISLELVGTYILPTDGTTSG